MENYTLTKDSALVKECTSILQNALNEAIKGLKAIDNKWQEPIDLKLHDAAMLNEIDRGEGYKLILEPELHGKLFDEFCMNEFDYFEHFMRDNHHIDFEEFIHRIGRTSKFYVGGFSYDSRSATPYTDLLAFISYDFNIAENIITSEKDDKITVHAEDSFDYFEDVHEYCYDCLAIAENLKLDVQEWIDKVNCMYSYISTFKHEQESNFAEFVVDYMRNNML